MNEKDVAPKQAKEEVTVSKTMEFVVSCSNDGRYIDMYCCNANTGNGNVY